MTNAKSPADSSCFGYIILSSIEDARKCISSLNNTELNGNLISVTFDKVDLMKVSHSSSPFSNTYENYFISLFHSTMIIVLLAKARTIKVKARTTKVQVGTIKVKAGTTKVKAGTTKVKAGTI